MEWTSYRLLLAFISLSMGSMNVLFGKWADRCEAEGTPGYPARQFNHPFFQTVAMFLGEMVCLIPFCAILIYRKQQGHSISPYLGHMSFNFKRIFTQKSALAKSVFVFFPPAMCDLGGTSLMYIALNYTSAASYQMLRGAVIIFTALLSVAFLGRVVKIQNWAGIFFVLAGLIIVGLADLLFISPTTVGDMNSIITGDELVVMAQCFSACQMVIEEKFITKLDAHPLLAVGLEGFFGFTMLSLLLIAMYFIPVGPQFSTSPEYRLEDVFDAFAMMANNWQICVAILGIVFTVAICTWAGVSITKELSATTRMVLDSGRTLIIWVACLALRWQDFQWLQAIGFVVLTAGIFIYNEILTPKMVSSCKCWKGDQKILVAEETETAGDI